MSKESDLIKMAQEDELVKSALIILAKHADDNNEATQFNEKVPATEGVNTSDPNAQQGASPAVGAGAPAPVPEMAMPGMMQPQEQGLDPAAEGAKAAQAFLAPVFEAASQGDPNAIQVISTAAGEIARGVAMAAAAQGQGGAPAPSPEESAANQLIPPVAPVAAAPAPDKKKKEEEKPKDKSEPSEGNGKPDEQQKTSELKVSMSVVEKLVKMAKANLI